MQKKLQILDCTLRDGGYINNWNFKNEDILDTIDTLQKSKVDIIECGFLDSTNGLTKDSTKFKSFQNLASLSLSTKKNLFVVMIEYGKYYINSLPICNKNSLIKGIRFSFRKSDYKKSLKEMKSIKKKGYKLFIQPISINSYTKNEMRELFKIINKVEPYAAYIVDTQGSMLNGDFKYYYKLFNKHLHKDIILGFHSHNNMQLSYSISIDFIKMAKKRAIIIDSSIYGMGRGAGNLNTELIMNYVNKKIGKRYNLKHILELIDKYYSSLFIQNPWGYSLAHFLSASYKCHPNYASYLINKKHLSIDKITEILDSIPPKQSFEYDIKLINRLYFKFYCAKVHKVKEPFFNKKVLLIGSGENIKEKRSYINANLNEYTKIAINHIPKNINIDYIFFSNIKRYKKFIHQINNTPVILTNNINKNADFYLNTQKISQLENMQNDNSVIMFINFLKKSHPTVYLAGIDGYKYNKLNYIYHENDRIVTEKDLLELNDLIQQGLNSLQKEIRIVFLTKSIFSTKD